MTDALAESLRFPIGGPPLALSQPGRRGTIRQIPIGFPEHGHFGFTDSTASALGGGRVPIICWMPAKKDPPPRAAGPAVSPNRHPPPPWVGAGI